VSRPRVLLADDHRLVSEGLKSLLTEDFDIVGMVEDGRALVASAKELHPDVIVADISMPHLNGIDAIAQLKKSNASVKVILLTMHQDPAYARRALEAGAVGFVVKHSAPAEIVMAIHAALKGQTFITPALASDVLRQAAHGSEETREDAGHLTPRQREILQFLAEGCSAKEIAARSSFTNIRSWKCTGFTAVQSSFISPSSMVSFQFEYDKCTMVKVLFRP
jgi:DNA-binding NarL/FixJ family response regulator